MGALAILFLYSSGFTSSHIHLLLTEVYLNFITTQHPKLTIDNIGWKITGQLTGCQNLLLSNRRHQLNYEQALQSFRPVFSGSLQYTLSGHLMFGETAIINCFFKICLCKSSKHQSHRAAKPTDQQVTGGQEQSAHAWC